MRIACPNCGAPVNDGDVFCQECGKKIDEIPTSIAKQPECPHCGASIKDGVKFCPKCGMKPTDSPIEANETAYKGESEKKSGFKKYLPYILGAFVVLSVIFYFNLKDSSNEENSANAVIVDSTSTDNDASVSAKEIITKRLEEIFGDVVKGNYDYDEKYFSSDFNRIYHECEDIDNRFRDDGNLGFWDSGFWDMAQDEVKLSVTINDVYDAKDKEAMAKIAFKFTYFDGSSETRNEDIKVVLENGKWVLDDLHGYKKRMKEFVEDNKDFQPSSSQNNLDWLQGHWVYEQGNYKSHLEISGNTIKTYSSMNPSPEIATFTINGDELIANTKGMTTVVKIDFNNHRIDWGDGRWMYKVSSSSSQSYSNTNSSNSQQQIPFTDKQEAVDLGLSVKWGTMNIGASNVYDAGEFFAWGETESKGQYEYDWRHYFDAEILDGGVVIMKMYKWNSYNSIKGHKSYDVAAKRLGGHWRMPTPDEFRELAKNCTLQLIYDKNIDKYYWEVIGKNGNIIILPETGFMGYNGHTSNLGKLLGSFFWTTSLDKNDNRMAYSAQFSNVILANVPWAVKPEARRTGFTVRPVYDE